MKNILFSGILILALFSSCEKNDRDVFFKIVPGSEYRFSDIEIYDTSTHMIYFRDEHNDFNNLEKGTFTFLDNGDPIYSGSLWPGYSSSSPSGPFIMSPSMYGNYALRIGYWRFDKPDVRDNPRLIQILKQHGLLHSGLVISSSSIEFADAQLIFKFTVSNQDQSDLLIIDMNKTGINLFHYFTNGLYIYDLANNEVFSGKIQHQIPDPWNSWKTEWLSELKSGDSKEFTISYPLIHPLTSGEYKMNFEFPGLGQQVLRDQLYQSNGRIWLGGVSLRKSLHVD